MTVCELGRPNAETKKRAMGLWIVHEHGHSGLTAACPTLRTWGCWREGTGTKNDPGYPRMPASLGTS